MNASEKRRRVARNVSDTATAPVAIKGTEEEEGRVRAFRHADALGFLARRLNALASAIFFSESGQGELTTMQMGILLTVHKAELISLRELSRTIHVDRSTLQEVVNRLVRRGLIDRRRPATDRRSHELWLTTEGFELLRTHLGAMERIQSRLLEAVDPADAEIAVQVLQTILARHDY